MASLSRFEPFCPGVQVVRINHLNAWALAPEVAGSDSKHTVTLESPEEGLSKRRLFP